MAFGRESGQLRRLVRVHRQRLFTQDVLALTQDGTGLGKMKSIRCYEMHGIDRMVREHVLQRGMARLDALPLGRSVRLCRIGADDCRHLDARTPYPFDMDRPDKTGTHHGCSKGFHLSFLGCTRITNPISTRSRGLGVATGHRVGWNDLLGVGIEQVTDLLEAPPQNMVHLKRMLSLS